MAPTASMIDLFNNKMSEFCRDLTNMYPNDSDLMSFKTAFKMSILVDEFKPVRLFHRYVVLPFGTELLNRDECVFLNPGAVESAVKDALINESSQDLLVDTLLTNLRRYWSQMSGDDRDAVWNYFKVLILLSKKLMD